jgi:hypothetical protein
MSAAGILVKQIKAGLCLWASLLLSSRSRREQGLVARRAKQVGWDRECRQWKSRPKKLGEGLPGNKRGYVPYLAGRGSVLTPLRNLTQPILNLHMTGTWRVQGNMD